MGMSRKKALKYAEHFLERPSSKVPVSLFHGKTGITLLCRGRALTKCHNTIPGVLVAPYLAQALGLEMPALGKKVSGQTTTGVINRALSISTLDLRNPIENILLDTLLEEADGLRMLKGNSAN